MGVRKKIANRIVRLDTSIFECLQKMDAESVKLLFVYDNNKFCSILTIGDIQRAIIRNVDIGNTVATILDTNKIYSSEHDSTAKIKKLMIAERTECMPVINKQGDLVNVYFWTDFFPSRQTIRANIDLPVVIMAGGAGSRLQPLTNILPKPLIPIREKSMLEEIFDRFACYGCTDFYISVNYKDELIKFYINSLNLPLNIHFFKENKPLGTAGSLTMMKKRLKSEHFFVTNCDILIEQDYSEILQYHMENNHEITIVAALKNYHIPYGVVETGENGILIDLQEKPDITLKVNSGMYLLKKSLLNEIPENVFFHITDLIKFVQQQNGKIGVFPVSEGSWKDMGEWENYFNMINRT
ncbi:MAG: NTP transferase domain-containing protein [Bacteroidales bacterium]|jgi:dTDP-glucose pyrophosphorylase|nr:NTP transferase domain-containing protein [Bacteroidales bacterium]